MVRATGETRVGNIRDIFAQRDWNTIEDQEENKEFGVERMLGDHVDGPAAPGLDALRRSRFPLLHSRREAVGNAQGRRSDEGKFPRENFAESISEISHLMFRLAAANYSDEAYGSHRRGSSSGGSPRAMGQ